MWLALIDMQNDKWQIMYQNDTYERWQNAEMANYVSIGHIQKKDANGMICQYTYIIYISHA